MYPVSRGVLHLSPYEEKKREKFEVTVALWLVRMMVEDIDELIIRCHVDEMSLLPSLESRRDSALNISKANQEKWQILPNLGSHNCRDQ